MARAIERLQIDTRAQGEVRRLSGGNQQKVTIARWIAGGVETLLCFDPTRGIDIRTKRQIYHLLRELAAAGSAVLLYTSELEEVQLVCDRAVVIFGGRVVDEMPAQSRRRGGAHARCLRTAARRARRRRRCRGRRSRDRCDHGRCERWQRLGRVVRRVVRRNGWVLALWALLGAMLVFTKVIQPDYGASAFAILTLAALPYAFATAGQTMAIIAGGIDLSIAAMMTLISVTAAVLMEGQSEEFGVVAVGLVLLAGLGVGAINGLAVVITRVPDIVVTLAFFFIWEGVALIVLEAPGGASAVWLKELIIGTRRRRVPAR